MEELLAAATPQPPPQPGRLVVADYVMADIQERVKAGLEKYGTKLMTNNGRNAGWDLYQELIDAVMYQRQKLLEEETRPHIVCLCGSTRFYDEFQKANFELTMQGSIVLSVGFFTHSTNQAHGGIEITFEEKRMLDQLHLRKIDLADSVFVVNVDGYIGQSTDNQIRYAIHKNKKVRFLVDNDETYYRYYPDMFILKIGRNIEMFNQHKTDWERYQLEWAEWKMKNPGL